MQTHKLASHEFPIVVSPSSANEATFEHLHEHVREQRPWLRARLHDEGAVLFRGFAVSTPVQFEAIVKTIGGELLSCAGGNAFRAAVSDRVYHSSYTPPEKSIPMHSEMAYTSRRPELLFFLSRTPAETGGETPLASTVAVARKLDKTIKARFVAHGVRFTRHMPHDGQPQNRSWREVFETIDKAAVEDWCRQSSAAFEWTSYGLKIWETLPCTATHPVTREECWATQADIFHPRIAELAIAAAVKRRYGEDVELRVKAESQHRKVNAAFGDGSPISGDDVVAIQALYRDVSVAFPWQTNDLLIIDNLRIAHGRNPYTGPRELLVAMTGAVEVR